MFTFLVVVSWLIICNCSPLIPEEREQGVRRVSRRDEDRAAGQGLTERLKGGTAVQPTCGDDG
jgi:hypothetical protein